VREPEASVGVLILGGGEATRLPGKLALDTGEIPMLARVYRNVGAGRETWLAGKGSYPAALDALLPIPVAIDRWSLRGPLAGLVTTMAQMHARWVFAISGDAPLVDASFVDALAAERQPGDEAIVPVHERDGKRQLEPLAALYDRLAFLREGVPVLRSGGGELRKVIDRLQTRYVEIADARIFTNVNTPQDYEALKTTWPAHDQEH
jgi:molybdopterin-guanine dinucleotide biosynthesis protein A